MNGKQDALKMLQELADAPGASGFEDEVVKIARRWAKSGRILFGTSTSTGKKTPAISRC